jgi:hypothetical protein
LPLEVHDFFTLAANEMVVPHARCLKSGLTFDCIDLADKPVAFKGSQGSVDGVQ